MQCFMFCFSVLCGIEYSFILIASTVCEDTDLLRGGKGVVWLRRGFLFQVLLALSHYMAGNPGIIPGNWGRHQVIMS